jgi:hypothetical protein
LCCVLIYAYYRDRKLSVRFRAPLQAGNTNSYQDYNSSIYQLFDNGTQSNLNPDYINDVQYRFNDAYLGVHYKFITGKRSIQDLVFINTIQI